VLIIGESCIGAFLLIILLQFYPCSYLALSFYSCTCWVVTISVLNLAILPCYSKLLLRRRGLTGILQWGVLGYVLPRLSFLWCYGVFHCSAPLRVIIVIRDTIYVIIIILYSWHLVFCEHFWPYVWNNWSWVMHMMSTWFWYKNWVWHMPEAWVPMRQPRGSNEEQWLAISQRHGHCPQSSWEVANILTITMGLRRHNIPMRQCMNMLPCHQLPHHQEKRRKQE
jgi:hypothetical protein